MLIALALCLALPAAALAEKVYISSTGKGTLNLRTGPGKEYDVKGYVKHGAKVSVLDEDGDWSKVKVSSTGKTGWIKTIYIDGTTKDLGTGTKVVETDSPLPLRAGPGADYAKKGTVYDGDTCKVLYTEDDWVKITVNGMTGWIMAYHITDGEDEPPVVVAKANKVYHVTATTLNMRKGAGTGYKIVAKLGQGAGFQVLGSSGNWYRIKTFDGVTGWISKTYTAPNATATVTASSLNVRTGAGTSYKVIGGLRRNTLVTVDSVIGNWAHVTAGSTKGYASIKFMKF